MKITRRQLRRLIKEELNLIREYTMGEEAVHGANLVRKYTGLYNDNKDESMPDKQIYFPSEIENNPLASEKGNFYKMFGRLVDSSNMGLSSAGDRFVFDMTNDSVDFLRSQIDLMQCLAGDTTDTGDYGNSC